MIKVNQDPFIAHRKRAFTNNVLNYWTINVPIKRRRTNFKGWTAGQQTLAAYAPDSVANWLRDSTNVCHWLSVSCVSNAARNSPRQSVQSAILTPISSCHVSACPHKEPMAARLLSSSPQCWVVAPRLINCSHSVNDSDESPEYFTTTSNITGTGTAGPTSATTGPAITRLAKAAKTFCCCCWFAAMAARAAMRASLSIFSCLSSTLITTRVKQRTGEQVHEVWHTSLFLAQTQPEQSPDVHLHWCLYMYSRGGLWCYWEREKWNNLKKNTTRNLQEGGLMNQKTNEKSRFKILYFHLSAKI